MVTLSVDQVMFREPIHVGELVTFLASVNHTGTSSMEIGIKVVAENIRTQAVRHVNSCFFTMVAVDDDRKPVAGAAAAAVHVRRDAAATPRPRRASSCATSWRSARRHCATARCSAGPAAGTVAARSENRPPRCLQSGPFLLFRSTMNSLSAPSSASFATPAAARIAGSHGYRIDRDRVHLHAELEWHPEAADWAGWSLQLWAQPRRGSDADAVPVKVAEVPLTAAAHAGAGPLRVEGSTVALPPAGTEACAMALLLRAARDGGSAAVHDQVAFAREQRFVQPRLEGSGGYRFEGDRVVLSAQRIDNPRRDGNLSGHLALELWALAEPYRGGAFAGLRVGGAALGRLAGQQAWHAVGESVAAAPLPPGRWHLCLMLREWTAAGYVTRDYVGFRSVHAVPQPVGDAAPRPTRRPMPAEAQQPAPPLDRHDPAVLAEPRGRTAPHARRPRRGKRRRPPSADLPVALADAAAEAAQEPPTVARSTIAAAAATVVAGPAAVPVPLPGTLRGEEADGRMSVNGASEAELAGLKGLSRTVAKAIVAGRPYATLEALLDLKGIGPKLLAKWRSALKL